MNLENKINNYPFSDNLKKSLFFILNKNHSSRIDCLIMIDRILDKSFKTVLELGVSLGKSTVPLLIATYHNKGLLVSNDIKDCEQNVLKLLEDNNVLFLKDSWHFIKANDLDLDFNDKFDMIFLDTSHEYDYTILELEKFSEYSDLIFLHDYNLYGVRKPVKLFVKKYPEWHLKIYKTPLLLAELSK